MATFTEKQLGQGQIANGSNTTLYTVPSSTTAIVKDIHITNITSSAATITVWLIDTGSTTGDGKLLLKDFSIPANDFLHWSGFQVLEATGTIIATAGTASAITITVSGAELT